jgi:hypothetical protein
LPKNAVPVVLSMRQPLSTLSERNANPSVWLSFIDRCRIDFPEILFVVVGYRDEVFDGLMEMPNVVISKSYGTSIIEDLALVRLSFLYLATTSGINTIVMFSDTPYLIFQMPNINSYGLKIEDRFSFSTDKQKVFGTEILVTPDLLYREFKKLYQKLNTKEWHIRVFGNNER